ncbi:MoeA, N-terminal and linker domain-containing protein [Halenospora varia]|nr:MoeA, N-terminal and linker domain-containing protein [Halenospora varia]
MAVSYENAIDILQKLAKERFEAFARDAELVPLSKVVGRICQETYFSLSETPSFDTSTVDGFVLDSDLTREASPSNSITFCVQTDFATTEDPKAHVPSEGDFPPSLEIKSGARFPEEVGQFTYDACIKVEDTTDVDGPDGPDPLTRYIQITRPALRNQNRRFAGSDFEGSDLLIPSGSTIKPHHIMALATIRAHDDIRDEEESEGRDSVGPYTEATLLGLGVEVVNLGAVKDDGEELRTLVTEAMEGSLFDAIVLTETGSMGKSNLVRKSIENMGAKICIDQVGIRPGYTFLSATLPRQKPKLLSQATNVTPPTSPGKEEIEGVVLDIPEVPFFALPGSPLAAAVCLRFLVIPYLRSLHSIAPLDSSVPATFRCPANPISFMSKFAKRSSTGFRKPSNLKVFWHGNLEHGSKEASISTDQAPSKIRPLLHANCWIAIAPGLESAQDGDTVETYEMYPQSLGCENKGRLS